MKIGQALFPKKNFFMGAEKKKKGESISCVRGARPNRAIFWPILLKLWGMVVIAPAT